MSSFDKNKGLPGSGSDGTRSSTSQGKAHSEDDFEILPPIDSSSIFGTSPATSGDPDENYTHKSMLSSDAERPNIIYEIGNEMGNTILNNGRSCCPRYNAPSGSSPRTMPDITPSELIPRIMPVSAPFERTSTPDIDEWVRTQYRAMQNAENPVGRQVTYPQAGALASVIRKPKQNPAGMSAGELLQNQDTEQTSDTTNTISKNEDPEEYTEDSM